MHGSLAFRAGVLYVGRHAKTAWVRAYDLDGRALGTSFSFRDADSGRSSVAGLAVDLDHRLWIADGAARRVRVFTLFGREVACAGDLGAAASEEDARGRLGVPVDLALDGEDDALVVAVASRGERRHALQLFEVASARVLSVRPRGDPRGAFHGLRGIALDGERLHACEAGRSAVHVYRGEEFHFEFPIPVNGGRHVAPVATALLPDGRSVVAVAGDTSALLLFDAGGRLLRTLASAAETPGAPASVDQPDDVLVVPGADDRATRVVALDREGERVQVLTLEGRCFGEFPGLAVAEA